MRTEEVFRAVGVPSVAAVVPAVAATSGGINVTVLGENFGENQGDVAEVLIGGQACLQHYYVSDTLLLCTHPPGTGTDHEVVVLSSAGYRTSNGALFSYQAPQIASVIPDRALEGPVSQDFVITGSNLAATRVGRSSPVSLRTLRGAERRAMLDSLCLHLQNATNRSTIMTAAVQEWLAPEQCATLDPWSLWFDAGSMQVHRVLRDHSMLLVYNESDSYTPAVDIGG